MSTLRLLTFFYIYIYYKASLKINFNLWTEILAYLKFVNKLCILSEKAGALLHYLLVIGFGVASSIPAKSSSQPIELIYIKANLSWHLTWIQFLIYWDLFKYFQCCWINFSFKICAEFRLFASKITWLKFWQRNMWCSQDP